MKLKEGLNVSTSDPWYDLADGGYLRPTELCESVDDAARVTDAVAVIKEFFEACQEQIDGFLQ